MLRLADPAREAAEDVFFGQVVMIWARWAMIAAAAVLFLWNTGDVGSLTQRVLLLAGLMAVNFFLHGRYLMEQPANRVLILLASLADVALIAAAVALWGGFGSQLFVLLYPVVFAFALVLPPRFAAALTVLAAGLYAGAVGLFDLSWAADVQQVKTLLVRLLALGAVGGLGTYYWRIQRDRRRAAMTAALGR
jgi:hypothetical protein